MLTEHQHFLAPSIWAQYKSGVEVGMICPEMSFMLHRVKYAHTASCQQLLNTFLYIHCWIAGCQWQPFLRTRIHCAKENRSTSINNDIYGSRTTGVVTMTNNWPTMLCTNQRATKFGLTAWSGPGAAHWPTISRCLKPLHSSKEIMLWFQRA